MKFVPNSISRFGHRSMMKMNYASPTLLVVGGVVGLGATAVLAARATRQVDPIIDEHQKDRMQIAETVYTSNRARQKDLLHLYTRSARRMTRLYGPTITVGVASAGAVLAGHKILHGRHVATVAAYTGLVDQFEAYRRRVAKTWGENVEKSIYDGAHGEWKDSEDHPGEKKLMPVYDEDGSPHYARPWFDETNPNWTRDPVMNYAFLNGVQSHMNNMLAIRGHLFLNEALDALGMPRCHEGSVMGWVYDDHENGDGAVDFGFMTGRDPQTVAFRNKKETLVRLNFNVDRLPVWNRFNVKRPQLLRRG